MSGICRFFIDRPIFAAVISIVIVLAGGQPIEMLERLAGGQHHADQGDLDRSIRRK